MESVYLALLTALGAAAIVWLVWRKKDRRRLARIPRIRWSQLREDIAQSGGFLVLDTAYGNHIGLGCPVVWWCPGVPDGTDLGLNEQMRDSGTVVLLPEDNRNVAFLRAELPKVAVVENNVLVVSLRERAPKA